MTTTAFDDQFTVGTQTIETVRQPYDTVSILKRNVADLELELKRQTERTTHKGATHCDDCGLNPLGCPYCKESVPAPAVPVYLLERQENGLSWYIGATTRWGGSWHWTADVNSAIRFSREEDAVACWVIISQYHVGLGGSGTTETTPKQHIFYDASALLQSTEATK